MKAAIFSFLITFVFSSESAAATEEATREFCTLPDTIYADGVDAASFSAASWNYNNADQWADIVVTCGGSHQSPIDIVTTGVTQESIQPQINYKSKASDIAYEEAQKPYTKEYEGEYSEIEVMDASNKVYKYYAKQFHIHTPSEHTIDGKYFDLEIHFVHQAVSDGEQDCNLISNKLTVFGLMFTSTEGAADYEVFKPWFDTNTTGEVTAFDLSDFFTKMKDMTYYHYNGSLTTLPCSQTVNWIVFYEPLPINPTQLASFQSYFADSTTFPAKHNNRPIQHLNGRPILKGVAITAGVGQLPEAEAAYGWILAITVAINFIL